jgi:hypothetical protein
VKNIIDTYLDTWLESTATDLDHPEDIRDPGIQTRVTNARENSSEGDVSYLSTSAGTYDSMIENEGDEEYNKAPTQKSKNFAGISGLSWA